MECTNGSDQKKHGQPPLGKVVSGLVCFMPPSTLHPSIPSKVTIQLTTYVPCAPNTHGTHNQHARAMVQHRSLHVFKCVPNMHTNARTKCIQNAAYAASPTHASCVPNRRAMPAPPTRVPNILTRTLSAYPTPGGSCCNQSHIMTNTAPRFGLRIAWPGWWLTKQGSLRQQCPLVGQ